MSRAESGPAGLYHRVVVYVLFVILLLPLAGTLLYSLSTSWSASLLPSGLTFKWYVALWSDPRFLTAFAQSLLVCVGALLLSVVLILPLLFVVHYHFPKLDALMNILILLPFAVPPVVSSVGLLQVYGSGPLAMVGTLPGRTQGLGQADVLLQRLRVSRPDVIRRLDVDGVEARARRHEEPVALRAAEADVGDHRVGQLCRHAFHLAIRRPDYHRRRGDAGIWSLRQRQ